MIRLLLILAVVCIVFFLARVIIAGDTPPGCTQETLDSGILKETCKLVLLEVKHEPYMWYDDTKGSQDGYN